MAGASSLGARYVLLLGLASLAAVAPGPGRAQGVEGDAPRRFEAPFQVVADEVEFDAARDGYVARGNVKIEQKGRTLTADRVFFSNKTRIGIASGDVVVTEAGDTLTAQFLEFNVADLTGVVFQGRLESTASEFEMTGEEVQKTGEQTYRFTRGRFTSCRCPKPEDTDPWTLTAERAELELEGYARARNATMEVLGVPVLWAPYVILPLKRDRQTGFLPPDFGLSERNGFEASLPFFWAARENLNVTLTPEYLSKRGFKPSSEIEYVFGERGEGEAYGTWIDDSEVDRDDPSTPFDEQRWGATWVHVMDLPAKSWLAVDGIAVSDNEVPFDFQDFQVHRADRYLHSRALGATRFGPTDAFGLEAAILNSDDLQNPNDQDRDDFLLQRLPEMSWTALPGAVPGIPGLVASADVEYVNFQPYGDPDSLTRDLRVGDLFYDTGSDAIPDGEERDSRGNKVPFDVHQDNGRTEIDGLFQEGEPLADQGHRLVAHPRLAYPLRLADAVELYPEVGYYGTFYDTHRAGNDARHLATARVDLRTRLRGEMELPFGVGPARHLVEPRLSWVGVTDTRQDSNPLLVPRTAVPQDRLRQLALDNLILDPSDRLDEVSSLVFAVGNRLFSGSLGSLLGELDLSGEYRIDDSEWGPAVLQGEAQLPRGWWLRFQSSYDVEEIEVADGLADLGWSHEAGHVASVRYRYIRDIPRFFEAFVADNERYNDFKEGFLRVNQLGAFGRLQLTRQWAFTYLGSYSFENALSFVNQLGVEYLSRCRCWAIRLELEDDRVRGLAWSINYRLVGLGHGDRDRPFGTGPGAARFDGF